MKTIYNIIPILMVSFFFNTIDCIGQVIVVDPGHGYAADGSNPDGRTDTEHATALSVGLKLRDKIESSCNGWSVRLTRTIRNSNPSLAQRRALSNSLRADRFISIHCNAGGGTGTETFWCNRSNSRDADNSRFSREIQNRMVEKGQWRDRRSVEDASFIFHLGVLVSNNAIGVLNEIGFVDTSDANKLLNDTWRNRFTDAYLVALENDLNTTCSGGGNSGDTVAPTTAISATGGNTQSGDFTANFNDNDNVGVTRRFYQALEKYGNNWYANRGNGFFNDNFNVFYSGYTQGAGNWSINDGHLRQTNTSSDNTKLNTFLSQNSGLPYLYEFSAKTISTTGPRKFGIHIMSDDVTQSQRGNSYLIWFSGEDNKLRIYETVNNVLNFRAITDVSLDNQWANYKITYSPAFGVLEIFRNNASLLRWTDTSPIKNGSSISLRTNKTSIEFDDLKVYKFRANQTQSITAGSAVTKDIRRQNGKIKSLVRDAAGNWSTPGNLDITISSLSRQNPNLVDDTKLKNNTPIIYPNPTTGEPLTLTYNATSNQQTEISIWDITGKLLNTMNDKPSENNQRNLDISGLLENVTSGNYIIKVKNGKNIFYSRILKQ
ncbi:T9SS C-terminal target domain-containing protein [Aquimarina sp. BL5]|uniref:N-acetylmuramoyl-L-alanine amidase n=1 Tax=Aquimarina sp. BL5 TaxID=1714860 RepID=UPI000E54F36A|nr:N-acetylmuramoyl-L-alanine amidase [Aquimarina sp. BL5]AXT53210.1 T9SS C-terminal target domain-containing protein [Aquimarina sp. BL5]RKN02868.1 T9SS C-terminal target domain-containing protein [Aquimarina sp. BL5]